MDLTWLYPWLVLAHVLASFGFVAMHGVSLYVLIRLRRERDPDTIRGLLNLSGGALLPTYAFLGLILLTGIVTGIVGEHWTNGRFWLWASLAILVALFVYMSYSASGYTSRLRGLAGLAYNIRGKEFPAGTADDAALLAALDGPSPLMAILAVGTVGLVVLVGLMELKPF